MFAKTLGAPPSSLSAERLAEWMDYEALERKARIRFAAFDEHANLGDSDPFLDISDGRNPFVVALNRDDRDNIKSRMLVEIVDPSSGRCSRALLVTAWK